MNTHNFSPPNSSTSLDTDSDLINKSRRLSEPLRLLQMISKSNNDQAILHRESQLRRQHIAALAAIDIVISAGIDLRITLWLILKQLTTLSYIEAATILVLDPYSQRLEQIISHSTPASRSVSAKRRQIDGQKAILEKKMVQRSIQLTKVYRRQQKMKYSTGSKGFVSYLLIPLIVADEVKGVLELFKHVPCDQELVSLGYLSILAEQAALAIHQANLSQSFAEAHIELLHAYEINFQSFPDTVEQHKEQSIRYTEQIAELTVQLARKMGLSQPEQLYMRWGALLHHIGNMAVPEKLLASPNPLSTEEWDTLRNHPTYAYQMLDPISYLQQALDIPYCHHEKWDGTGYPRGLKGAEIPLAARLFAVIDAWIALHSEPPSHKTCRGLEVENYIREQAGKQFDPAVVEAFLKMQAEQRLNLFYHECNSP